MTTTPNKYSTMNRSELAKAYVDKIGYNPFEDDAAITESEVAQTLAEYDEELLRDIAAHVNAELTTRYGEGLDEEQMDALLNPTQDAVEMLEDMRDRMGVQVSDEMLATVRAAI